MPNDVPVDSVPEYLSNKDLFASAIADRFRRFQVKFKKELTIRWGKGEEGGERSQLMREIRDREGRSARLTQEEKAELESMKKTLDSNDQAYRTLQSKSSGQIASKLKTVSITGTSRMRMHQHANGGHSHRLQMAGYLKKRRVLHEQYAADSYAILESKYWIPPLTCVMQADGEPKHFWPIKTGVYTEAVST